MRALTLLLVVLSAPGCLEPGSLDHERAAIVGGQEAPGDPAVVAVVARRLDCNEVPRVICTGTLIAPRVVLTAGHCIGTFGDRSPYEIYIGPAVDGSAQSYGIVVDAVAHPLFASTPDHDLGLLLLADEAPVAPVALPASALDDSAIGLPARAVGYGSTAAGTEPDGIKRDGLMQISELGPARFRADADPAVSCSGDSGGPVFVDLGAGEELVGVASRGDFFCGNYADNARVDVALDDFILPTLEDWADAPAGAPPGIVAPEAICGAECAGHDECPAALVCLTDFNGIGRCQIPGLSAGDFAEACTEDAECSGGRCARLWPSGPDPCRCLDSCDSLPPVELPDEGCACRSVRPGAAGWLALVLALLAATRRRPGRQRR